MRIRHEHNKIRPAREQGVTMRAHPIKALARSLLLLAAHRNRGRRYWRSIEPRSASSRQRSALIAARWPPGS